MKRIALIALALALAGCGTNNGVRPQEGKALPVAPYGAAAQPTPAELLTPSPQARPQRSNELLKTSEARRQDEFDLPPN
ncbi:MAG: hypothetical protein A4S12_08040 [Proteobacteria bacterium SG_bin5]|nr:hypothetical protein [Sphingomonas sp.]OQW41525.1 MAG: hypothetical protein A4S12_08040 [Proteobacteria bacterium SG_bin5]